MNEAINIVKSLLAVLPDSEHPDIDGDDCFQWCWNDLDDDSQELVKQARSGALDWLKRQEEGQ